MDNEASFSIQSSLVSELGGLGYFINKLKRAETNWNFYICKNYQTVRRKHEDNGMPYRIKETN